MRPLPEHPFEDHLKHLDIGDFPNYKKWWSENSYLPPTLPKDPPAQDWFNEITPAWAADLDPRTDLIHPFVD